MIKRYNRGLLAVCVFLAACYGATFLPSPLHGGERYEIRPEITVPEYKTDTVRVVEAYERLMNNYMRLTEQSFIGLGSDVKGLTQKLDAIDQKITALTVQVEAIRNGLDIELPTAPPSKPVDTDLTTAK